ncbi:choice-of-anchor K domain-containing protein [Actinosynnema sp. CA-299493]
MGRVVTNGSWTRVDPIDVIQLTGLGTGEIRWGDVPYERKSGYSFQGEVTDLKLDGSDFLLGTFTHHNRVIPLSADLLFAVDLAVILNFEEGNLQHPLPVLTFHHDETLNEPLNSNDVVEMPKVSDYDVLFVDNVEYKMSITGFLWNGRKVPRFDSEENDSNSAGIFARMDPTGRRGA